MASKKLLNDIKAYLDESFCDQEGERKLDIMTENAILYLNDLNGIENNYEEPGLARVLLFSRVQYDRANALDDFSINYRNDIIRFINRGKVKRYVESQKDQ